MVRISIARLWGRLMAAIDKILPIFHPISGIHIYYVTEDELRQIELETWTNRFYVAVLLIACSTLIEVFLAMLALPAIPPPGAKVDILIHPLIARQAAWAFLGASILAIVLSGVSLLRGKYHSTIAVVRARGVGAAGEKGKEISPAVLQTLKSEEPPGGPQSGA
jgi:hypothetical protein